MSLALSLLLDKKDLWNVHLSERQGRHSVDSQPYANQKDMGFGDCQVRKIKQGCSESPKPEYD